MSTSHLLGTTTQGRLSLQSSIIYYRLIGYTSRQVVARGTKEKEWNKQKYMNRIVCLTKLSLCEACESYL